MKLNLIANQTNTLGFEGRHFRLFTAAEPVRVEISTATGTGYFDGELSSGIGLDFSDRADFPDPFAKVRITSKSDQQIEVWASKVQAHDDRLSGNFDINAALSVAQTAPKSHNVPALQNINASTEVLPQRTTRKTALIQVSGPVYIGTADGPELSGLFSWDNQAALTLVPVSGAVDVRISEDYD